MCTRYRASRADIEAFARRAGIGFAEALRYFELEHDTWKSDVWPDYPAPTLLPAGDGAQAVMGRYGFWPKFMQSELAKKKIAEAEADGRTPPKKRRINDTYNARSEEIGDKLLYAPAWRAGARCLIPARYVVEPSYPDARQENDGNWLLGPCVWQKCGLADWEPFAVAGIWRKYRTADGIVTGVSMLTVNADGHAVMGRMHKPTDEKRSVVILRPEDYDEWLHTRNVEAARAMMQLLPADDMQAEPVTDK